MKIFDKSLKLIKSIKEKRKLVLIVQIDNVYMKDDKNNDFKKMINR